jgi:hypothetical protein
MDECKTLNLDFKKNAHMICNMHLQMDQYSILKDVL